MKKITTVSFLFILHLLLLATLSAQEWTPLMTDVFEPVPDLVTPGNGSAPPSDAVILFDGTDLSGWETGDGEEAQWLVADNCVTVVKGTKAIQTKMSFGDCQLHIEWRTPAEVVGEGQGRGNSGVFLQMVYELQVLDSYENETYVNGQAGAVYKQYPPLVNASLPPGEWQSYDVIYIAPRFKEDSTLFTPATMTVLHNGVLIQNHVALRGPTENKGLPVYKFHALKRPVMLQVHGNPVSYRNIWIREL